ncbi:gas vesicle protein [Streptomyces sp. LP05-1]|uniref:Gas vesicle protein n=1 Tax=Streptomyces pyxinae TaxID=2970734 RepID=A0ABT2CM60_9ACTN|nr:gas vesicle protein [Streptomyces sp. LP05-1]MCS0638532.1 gas vesicle protein [Streptomyces sp. LP05-1]
MTEPLPRDFGGYPSRAAPAYGQGSSANLADILERVLDKGIVIAGDIRINLLDIELLTIKLRLLVASVDKAKEMGIDWWEHDPALSSRARNRSGLAAENARLRAELDALRTGREVLPDADTTAGARTLTGAVPADEDAEVLGAASEERTGERIREAEAGERAERRPARRRRPAAGPRRPREEPPP